MNFSKYECEGQLNLFDIGKRPYKITKPIRLIELFAGVGSQAMALRDIGANFEHYRAIEWDKYAIASYNAIHGTEFPATDITQINGSDLGITDCDKFTYLLTYSFPCTDLSVAGKMLGMAEGSGTRSSLLWEVKRLLDECENLPQVLLMENVPQVHSKSNMPHFQKWLDYLESKGYSSKWQDLNTKNYGVAQSRNRTFVVSILGNYDYKFPEAFQLNKVMKDYLEPVVDEKYYLKSEKAKELIDKLIKGGKLSDEFEKYKNDKANYMPFDNAISYPLHSQDFTRTGFMDIAPTLSARDYKDPKIVIEKQIVAMRGRDPQNPSNRTAGNPNLEQRLEPNCEGIANTLTTVQKDNMVLELGYMDSGSGKHQSNIVIDSNGIMPCQYAGQGKNPMRFVQIQKLGNAANSFQRCAVYDANAISPTIQAAAGTDGNQQPMWVEVKQATKEGYIPCEVGGVADLNYPDSQTRRGRVQGNGQISPTLTTENIPSVLEPWIWVIDGVTYLIRIRKLTPKECWRLMGFTDDDFEQAAAVNSNTQLYKQAGNSIVKDVLCEVFKQLL